MRRAGRWLCALRSEGEGRRAAWEIRTASRSRWKTPLGEAVALAVMVLGACAARKGPEIDAWAPALDGGYPERFLTDAAVWSDAPDPGGVKDANSAERGDTRSSDGGTDAGADGGGASCSYLAAFAAPDAAVSRVAGDAGTVTCARDEACYAAPLMSAPTGRTLCALEGPGVELSPCVTQDDCDGRHACDGVGDGSGLCRVRCDPRNPVLCPRGTQCWAFPQFLTAGLCR